MGQFNEYLTEITPSFASEIDVSNKLPFNTYVTSPCTSSFYFQYTNQSGILKNIQGLKRYIWYSIDPIKHNY